MQEASLNLFVECYLDIKTEKRLHAPKKSKKGEFVNLVTMGGIKKDVSAETKES